MNNSMSHNSVMGLAASKPRTLMCLEKFNEPGAFTEHLCFECEDQQEAWGQGTPAGVGRLSTFGYGGSPCYASRMGRGGNFLNELWQDSLRRQVCADSTTLSMICCIVWNIFDLLTKISELRKSISQLLQLRCTCTGYVSNNTLPLGMSSLFRDVVLEETQIAPQLQAQMSTPAALQP